MRSPGRENPAPGDVLFRRGVSTPQIQLGLLNQPFLSEVVFSAFLTAALASAVGAVDLTECTPPRVGFTAPNPRGPQGPGSIHVIVIH